MHRYALMLLGTSLGLMACKGPGPATVGDATLAMAMGVEKVPAEARGAPLVEVLPGKPATIPDAPMVRLAIDRKARWGEVKAILDLMAQRKQTPVILVTERHNVRTLTLEDSFDGEALDLIAYTDGKSCVRHPDIAEAKCVQTPNGKYIDAAFTREIVREAVRGYGIDKVEVDLPSRLPWADVVRVVDGARTCCLGDPVQVKIRPPQKQPAPQPAADDEAGEQPAAEAPEGAEPAATP